MHQLHCVRELARAFHYTIESNFNETRAPLLELSAPDFVVRSHITLYRVSRRACVEFARGCRNTPGRARGGQVPRDTVGPEYDKLDVRVWSAMNGGKTMEIPGDLLFRVSRESSPLTLSL
jgi:hypothetical protein